jgi:hypothetical protein
MSNGEEKVLTNDLAAPVGEMLLRGVARPGSGEVLTEGSPAPPRPVPAQPSPTPESQPQPQPQPEKPKPRAKAK